MKRYLTLMIFSFLLAGQALAFTPEDRQALNDRSAETNKRANALNRSP